MKPCIDPKVCGVMNHHSDTICQAQAVRDNTPVPLAEFGLPQTPTPSSIDPFDLASSMTDEELMEHINQEWLKMGEPVSRMSSMLGVGQYQPASHRGIDAYLVIDPGNESDMPWGTINNRVENLSVIALGMKAGLQEWSNRTRGVDVMEYPGPCGPVYSFGTDGRHRLMVAAAMRVSNFRCKVRPYDLLEVGEPGMRRKIEFHMNGYRPQNRLQTASHIDRLAAAGYIDDNDRLARNIDVVWELESPKVVAKASQEYARRYPQFPGDNPKFQAMMTEESWVEYLNQNSRSSRFGRIVGSIRRVLRGN